MPDENDNVQNDVEKLNAKKIGISLLTKLGSGVIVLGIIGYAASWAFVTLNTLQEGVVKNSEKLDMMERGVEKDKEDKAQWGQIMIVRERSVDNEVEIRVLKELYKFYRQTAAIQKVAPKEEIVIPPPVFSPYVVPQPIPFPEPPKKKDKLDELYEQIMDRDKKKLETIDDFKHKSIQQIRQSTSPKR